MSASGKSEAYITLVPVTDTNLGSAVKRNSGAPLAVKRTRTSAAWPGEAQPKAITAAAATSMAMPQDFRKNVLLLITDLLFQVSGLSVKELATASLEAACPERGTPGPVIGFAPMP